MKSKVRSASVALLTVIAAKASDLASGDYIEDVMRNGIKDGRLYNAYKCWVVLDLALSNNVLLNL